MKIALMDIGSNSIRLEIYGVLKDGGFQKLLSKKDQAGLVAYVTNGRLNDRGINRLIKTLTKFHSIAQWIGVDEELLFATAVIRNVKNTKAILKAVKKQTGLTISLLTGQEEADLGYKGTLGIYPIERGVLIDIGGGSTEVTLIEDDRVSFSTSLAEGSLSLYKAFVSRLFPTKKESKAIEKHVRKILDKELPKGKFNTLYGSGGTMRGCGNVAQELFGLETNTQVSFEQLKTIAKATHQITGQTLQTMVQATPSRLHTLVPGLLIAKQIGKRYGCDQVYISKQGVREGFLMDYLSTQP